MAIIWRLIGSTFCVQRESSPQRHAGTVQGLLFERAIQIPPCGSGARVRARRDLRSRELFTHLEIADAHKLSRIACTLCPNIPVDVLGNPNHHSKRLVIRFGQATESPILEQIQPVIYSHPQVPGTVFQHGGDLITGKTIAHCEWRRWFRSQCDQASHHLRPKLCRLWLARTPAAISFPNPSSDENVVTARIAKAVYSACSSSPDDSFSVFKKSVYRVAGQALGLVHNAPPHFHGFERVPCLVPTQRLPSWSNDQGVNAELASIESGGHEWSTALPHFNRASPSPGPSASMPDPDRSFGTTCHGHYPSLSCVGFQRVNRVDLRDAAMPVDKRRLPSQPEAALPVSQ